MTRCHLVGVLALLSSVIAIYSSIQDVPYKSNRSPKANVLFQIASLCLTPCSEHASKFIDQDSSSPKSNVLGGSSGLQSVANACDTRCGETSSTTWNSTCLSGTRAVSRSPCLFGRAIFGSCRVPSVLCFSTVFLSPENLLKTSSSCGRNRSRISEWKCLEKTPADFAAIRCRCTWCRSCATGVGVRIALAVPYGRVVKEQLFHTILLAARWTLRDARSYE